MKQMITRKTKSTQGWKMIFPLLTLFLCLSCNKDDDDEVVNTVVPSFVKATIDGTQYTFNRIRVETNTVIEPDYTYVDLHVIANIEGDDTKQLEFSLEQNVAGTETIYFFYLMNADGEFDTDHTGAAFNTNVTTSTEHRITGTCSGILANVDNTNTITITDGSFDINYN